MHICDRIKEERRRLGLNQDALAAAVGVSTKSQVNYEAGRRQPDAAYLAALAVAGADVGYVITGRPSAPVAADESELLRLYRASPPAVREAALRMLGGTSPSGPDPGPRTVTGKVGQVVQGDAHVGRQTIRVGGRGGGKGGRKR